MFKFIKKYIIATRYAVLWVQALDYAAKKQNKEAKKKLIAAERLLSVLNIEYCLLRGYVECRLNCNTESRDFLDRAISKLHSARNYSEADLNYMEVYAQELINFLTFQQNISIKIDYSTLDLKNVSHHLIENFPITGN